MTAIRKKGLLTVLLVGLLLLLGATVASASGSREAAAAKTITIWGNWPDAGVQGLIQSYEKAHPGVKVNYLFIPWDNTTWAQKISTAQLSKSMPDLVETAQLPTEWSQPVRGVYRSLNDLVKRDNFDVQDFAPPMITINTLNGQLYGIPLWFDFGMLFYNKDTLSGAGINQPPATWSDLLTDVQKLTVVQNGKIRKMGIGFLEFPIYFSLNAEAGGYFFNSAGTQATFNTSTMQSAAKLLTQLRDLQGGMPELTRIASKETLGAEADSFVRNISAMIYMNAFSEISRIKKFAPSMNYGIAPLPAPDGKAQTVVLTAGANLMIPSEASNPNGGWDFLKFWTSKEQLLTFVKANLDTWAVLPARLSVMQDPAFLSIDPHVAELVKNINSFYPESHFVHPLATDPFWINMLKAVDDILWNKASVDSALTSAQQAAQDALDKTLSQLKAKGVSTSMKLY